MQSLDAGYIYWKLGDKIFGSGNKSEVKINICPNSPMDEIKPDLTKLLKVMQTCTGIVVFCVFCLAVFFYS
jgi:hypothetical protein